jgi:hypothetical protein
MQLDTSAATSSAAATKRAQCRTLHGRTSHPSKADTNRSNAAHSQLAASGQKLVDGGRVKHQTKGSTAANMTSMLGVTDVWFAP